MTAKEKFLKFVKETFMDSPAQMITLTTNEGVTIEVSEIAVGAKAVVKDSTNSDGIFTLETGEKLTIKDGIISEVVAPQAMEEPEEEPTPEPTEGTPHQENGGMTGPHQAPEFTAQNEKIKNLETELAAIKTEYEKSKSAMQSFSKDVANIKKAFAAWGNLEIEQPAAPQKNWEAMSLLERRRATRL